MELTTYEASRKYDLSTRYIRYLLAKKSVKGRQAKISSKNLVWLVDESSLKSFLATERKPGPKTKKTS